MIKESACILSHIFSFATNVLCLFIQIGTDVFGKHFITRFNELNIDSSCIQRTENAATGAATIFVDDSGEFCQLIFINCP